MKLTEIALGAEKESKAKAIEGAVGKKVIVIDEYYHDIIGPGFVSPLDKYCYNFTKHPSQEKIRLFYSDLNQLFYTD